MLTDDSSWLEAPRGHDTDDFDAPEVGPVPTCAPVEEPPRPAPLWCLQGGAGARQVFDGSWFMHLEPCWPHLATAIRGPLRIEARGDTLRASGDIYVRRGRSALDPLFAPITPVPFVVGHDWYPHLPPTEYAFHLASTGMMLGGDRLTIRIARHIWSRASGSFGAVDSGHIVLHAAEGLVRDARLPRPTTRLVGSARIGGRDYRVVATRTSRRYRGFPVAVDLLGDQTGGSIDRSISSAFHRAGLDVRVSVDDLPRHRGVAGIEHLVRSQGAPLGSAWLLQLLVGGPPLVGVAGALTTDASAASLGELVLRWLRRQMPTQPGLDGARRSTRARLVHAPDPHVAPGWCRPQPALQTCTAD